jgi:membrane fusion protein, multidrug efflux system
MNVQPPNLKDKTLPDQIFKDKVDGGAAGARSETVGARSSDTETASADTRPSWGGWLARKTLQVALPLLVIGVGFGIYSYLKATKPEKPAKPVAERVFAVTTAVVKPAAYQPVFTLYGTIVSGRQTDIRALVSGQVIETSPELREGGVVEAGNVLMRIDPFNFESAKREAEAQLAEAKARIAEYEASIAQETASLKYAKEQMELAKVDVDRAKPLARRGTVSKRTLDERQQVLLQRRQAADQLANAMKVWQARIDQQKAVISRLETAISLADRRLQETKLLAPFDAYVSEVTSQVGRLVGANDKIATLIDRDWIEARFTLTDEQYGRLSDGVSTPVGRKIDVIWSLGRKDVTYKATIDRIGARVDANAGGVEVFARIENPLEPISLRPGAFVQVKVPDRTFEDTYRIPSTALYDGNTVFVVEQGRLKAHEVTIEGGIENDFLIQGALGDKARVLTSRISTPGTGVRVREAE